MFSCVACILVECGRSPHSLQGRLGSGTPPVYLALWAWRQQARAACAVCGAPNVSRSWEGWAAGGGAGWSTGEGLGLW